MQLFSDSIEDTILTLLLQGGAARTTDLLERVARQRHCTRQGFYRSLRKLRNSEKVVIYRSLVSVNEAWARRARRLLAGSNMGIVGDFSQLGIGDELTLSIKGLTNMDRLWTHVFSVIEQEVPKKHPLFLYNPHNWSALLRQASDIEHERELQRRGRAVYLVVGSASALDKAVTKGIGFTHVQFSFNPKLTSQSYVAAVGEYVIEIKFAPKTRTVVDTIFKHETDVAVAREKLKKIDKTAAFKLVIERNPTKARQWERRIGNDFYFPRKR